MLVSELFLTLNVLDVDEDAEDDVVVDEIVDVAVAFEKEEDVASLTCCCCCWFKTVELEFGAGN